MELKREAASLTIVHALGLLPSERRNAAVS
jgi:hypothetical protein